MPALTRTIRQPRASSSACRSTSRSRMAGSVQCCLPSYSTPTFQLSQPISMRPTWSPYLLNTSICVRRGRRPASVRTSRVRVSCGDSAPASDSSTASRNWTPARSAIAIDQDIDVGRLQISGLHQRIHAYNGQCAAVPAPEVERRSGRDGHWNAADCLHLIGCECAIGEHDAVGPVLAALVEFSGHRESIHRDPAAPRRRCRQPSHAARTKARPPSPSASVSAVGRAARKRCDRRRHTGWRAISIDSASGHSFGANERIHVDSTAPIPMRFPRETELVLDFSPKLRT